MQIRLSLSVLIGAMAFGGMTANASAPEGDYLVQISSELKSQPLKLFSALPAGTRIEDLGINNWIHIKVPANEMAQMNVQILQQNPQIHSFQPNYRLHLLENEPLKNSLLQQQIKREIMNLVDQGLFQPLASELGDDKDTLAAKIPDNPAIPTHGSGGSGNDTFYSKQWGMQAIGVQEGWKVKEAIKPIVVAVIDTGVDYTHEDLVDNMWRNPGETGLDDQGRDKSTNGIDDDHNGFVDDVVGWDFASNDNKPYDLTVPASDLLFGGGNPGHGTHVSGCVAARAQNGKGVVGVADNNIKIMAMRFLTEKGQGTSADAIKAIRYAVDNGAQVTNNSWGSEGEDPAEATENKALRDVITYAESKGSLFIAAAGNGHNGVGYNNDTDAAPGFPASYPNDNIISVAAIDKNDNLGSFSNWGKESVDIAAPGVAIFSTMVGNKYNDLVIDLFGIKATWDGTSMASPHVAGAAALYWSRNPDKTWQEVKAALLETVQSLPSLGNKVSSGGKLDVRQLMNR